MTVSFPSTKLSFKIEIEIAIVPLPSGINVHSVTLSSQKSSDTAAVPFISSLKGH